MGGPFAVRAPSVLQTQGGRWLHCCCCSLVSALCFPALTQGRLITTGFQSRLRKEWIWLWRSSTLMPGSSTILSSSEVCYCQTSRYSNVYLFLRQKRDFCLMSESVLQPGFDVTFIYHHFYLRATNCPKGTTDSTGCQFRNDRVSFVCCRCVSWQSAPVMQRPRGRGPF